MISELNLTTGGTSSSSGGRFNKLLAENQTLTRFVAQGFQFNEAAMVASLEKNFHLLDVEIIQGYSLEYLLVFFIKKYIIVRSIEDQRQQQIVSRNKRVSWPIVHRMILNSCIAMSPLQLPPYVLLEIFDWLPLIEKHVSHVKKIHLIEKIAATIRKVKKIEIQ